MATSPESGFGRRTATDPRDHAFAMAPPRTDRTFRNWMSPGPVRDQGATPHCVAFSSVHFLTAHPVVNKPIDTTELYHACQENDEWEGTDYDGTSVRAAFKILRQRGYIKSYVWAWDADTVARHILTTGPVIVGTDWYRDMFAVDRAGYVSITGDMVGGHAYLLLCVNMRRNNPDGTMGAFRILNSWGAGWAQGGRAWITFQHMDRLIKADGEACAAVEQKLVAV